MERVTFRTTESQIEEMEAVVGNRFPNKSELIRTAVRDLLDDQPDEEVQPEHGFGEAPADD